MDFDIRGLWRYKAEHETCEGLRDMLTAQATAHRAALAAKDEVIKLQKEQAEKHEKKLVSKAIDVMFKNRDRLKRKHEEEVNGLQRELDESYRDYKGLKEYCDMLEDDVEKLKAKTAELEENAKLKKTRYRWVDSRHGWWPVESADLDDLVAKVPYVVYTMQKREEEEKAEKRIPEV